MDVFEESHGVVALAVAEPVNCEVPNAQVDKVPVNVGKAFVVKVAAVDVVDIVPELVEALTTQV